MKLEEDDGQLVAVRTCSEDMDVLLATAKGKCIRFPVAEVRTFSSRTSSGVRGIRLAAGDRVISMSTLEQAGAVEIEERDAYLRYAAARRRAESAEAGEGPCAPEEAPVELTEARLADLEAREQFILSISEDGYGKRTSAYEYRPTKRGGRGIGNMELGRGAGKEPSGVVGAFPIEPGDQIMLVTDGGKLIRSPVHDVRIAGRTTRGVRLFRIDPDERVVSVARLEEDEDAENGSDNGGADNGAPETGETDSQEGA
jgi:DNA gyrase subunit A